MFVDPFSAEYLQASFDERAKMYADAFDDFEDDFFKHFDAVEDYCPNPSNTMLVPVELVDDLPF